MTRPWRHAYRDPAPPVRTEPVRTEPVPLPDAHADTTAGPPPAQLEGTDDGPALPGQTVPAMARTDSTRMDALLVLEPIGDGLVAAADGSADIEESAAFARLIGPEADRLVVVLAGSAVRMVPELARRLRPWVSQGWESIRLVGSYAATAVDGSTAGQELADLLQVEVIAPDGELLAVPDGSLFVVGEADPTRHGAWWHFRPGGPPIRSGARFPEPDWEGELTTFADPGLDDIVVDQVPAGLWAHRPGPVELTDLALAMPVEEQSIVLLVSRPGDEPLPAARLRSLVAALPQEVRQRLIAVPYGDQPVADARLGAVLATALERSVRVRTGLAVQVDRSHRPVVAVDVDGLPTWQPLARELAWSPYGGPPRVARWAELVDDMFGVGLGQHAINRRWLVELIEAGLWIRPLGRPLGADLVRQIPLDARQCTIVVSAPGYGRVHPPWRAIGRLLRLLPADARMRLRLAVPADAGYRLAKTASRACRRELAGHPAYVLDAYGDIVPHHATRRPSAPRRTPAHRNAPDVTYPDGPPSDRSTLPQRTARDSNARDSNARRGTEPVARTGRSRSERSLDDANLVAYLDQLQAHGGSSDSWERPPPPELDLPDLDSPELDSPELDSPELDSPEPLPAPPAPPAPLTDNAVDPQPSMVVDAGQVVRPEGDRPRADTIPPVRGSGCAPEQLPATGTRARAHPSEER